MKKLVLMLSLLFGLSMVSCKDKDEPVLDFKLSQNEMNLIVGQSKSFEIKSGNAPYTLNSDEHIEASANENTITVKAIKCDAVALKATPVTLTLTDNAGKKQEVKINIYNTLDIATSDIKMFEGETADVRINAGQLEAFKLTVKDEKVATAEIASEMIGDVELKKILVTAKGVGETELTVTDGLTTTKAIKLVVKKIEPITIWGAVEGELKNVTDYTLNLGDNYNFVIKGGNAKFKLDYDKTKLVVGTVKEHDEDYVVNVAPDSKLKKSQDIKLTISSETDPSNKAELTIKVVVPKKEFGATYLKGSQAYTPEKDKDGDDVIVATTGEEITVELEGGSGDYYIKLSDGEALLKLGATGLEKGKRQYGNNKYDFYLIPNGTIKLTANTAFEESIPFYAVLDKGSFISRETKWITFKIK